MIKRSLKIFLIALFVSFSLWANAFAYSGDDILKIGIFYGSNALPTANLQNVTGIGSGYNIGYFDSSRNFTPIYPINDTKITVVKDKLIYIDASGNYYDVIPSNYSKVIEPYHLQLNESFSTIEELNSAVSLLKSYGLSAFPAYNNGKYTVRTGQYETSAIAEKAMTQVANTTGLSFTVVGYSNNCYTVTITGTNTILFEYDNSGAMGIMPRNDGGIKAQTWFKGFKYYGGFEYNRVNGNDITVMNIVSETDYIKGVIPYEMNPAWHIEALKVQALCAKSYAQNSIGKHKSNGFDLCNTTHCQVYQGTNKATTNSDNAVEAVNEEYVVYGGKIAQTYYHASSGGHTEDVENIWGSYLPYLRGVPDDYLKYVKSGYENWTYSVNLPTITNILISKGYNVTEITDFYVNKYSVHGNVLQLAVVDKQKGKLTFSGDTARTLLNSSDRKSVV